MVSFPQILSSPLIFPLTLLTTIPLLILLAISQSLFRWHHIFQKKISTWPLLHIAWCLQVVLQQGHVNTAHWLVSLPRRLLSLPCWPFSLAVSSTWNGVPSSPSWAGGVRDNLCITKSLCERFQRTSIFLWQVEPRVWRLEVGQGSLRREIASLFRIATAFYLAGWSCFRS